VGFIDCFLLGLLGIFENHPFGSFLGWVNLEGFRIFFFITRMRGVMSWARRRRPMDHNGPTTPLGRAHLILPFLGALITMGIHESEIEKHEND
jgi:hypothetical protein